MTPDELRAISLDAPAHPVPVVVPAYTCPKCGTEALLADPRATQALARGGEVLGVQCRCGAWLRLVTEDRRIMLAPGMNRAARRAAAVTGRR